MKSVNEEDVRNVNMNDYAKDYSEESLWDKVRENVSSIGLTVIYKAFQLYYVAQSDSCPMKVKAGIIGALGYLISPLDLVPDFIPVVGYSDDALAIAFALTAAQMYITDEVKQKAKDRIREIFGDKFVAKLEEEEDS
ncbi:YkvA family protein [Selenomonas ruminantium]|uniref:YkvA family protein n=1 Tax=Selenomonas ruminantium TaxID=971 RepID=UPI0026F299A4|nr:YkvA family protein [Selenomonas ruminantium]